MNVLSRLHGKVGCVAWMPGVTASRRGICSRGPRGVGAAVRPSGRPEACQDRSSESGGTDEGRLPRRVKADDGRGLGLGEDCEIGASKSTSKSEKSMESDLTTLLGACRIGSAYVSSTPASSLLSSSTESEAESDSEPEELAPSSLRPSSSPPGVEFAVFGAYGSNARSETCSCLLRRRKRRNARAAVSRESARSADRGRKA
mmetsp:Transcript_17567/g.60772  ORF Transcript_17567/g.60772 Transcript_17567/m.60772 type:complete len:202 (-) Transcript_17567:1950-2555(-)